MVGFGFKKAQSGFQSHSPDRVFTEEQIVDSAFSYFRATGFPYRSLSKYECMQEINRLARTKKEELFNSITAYSVADSYHPHRFDGRYRTNLSPKEAFDSDDTWLRQCLAKTLQYDGRIPRLSILGLHRSSVGKVKACSNFRPAFALLQYRKYCKQGDVVLDSCTGYGGRLVGWLASQCGRYIGIDPNTKVHEGNLKMASDFCRYNDVVLHCSPVEDLPHSKVEGLCDFAFTSPPYFSAEVYSDQSTQSCNRYKEAKQWRNCFLLPFMELQFIALKRSCHSCINIADVKMGNKLIPLVRWCIKAGERVGFVYEGKDEYKLKRYFGSGSKNKFGVRTESVLKFRKT